MPEKNLNNILTYITNEREISKYKLTILEKIKNPTPSQSRIIDIEKEFLSLPLEKMGFKDVPDIAAAISIYRTSRSQFFEIYKKYFSTQQNSSIKSNNNLNDSISFIKKESSRLKTAAVEEINLVQNLEFYYDLIKRISNKNGHSFDFEKKILDSKNINYLQSIEPAIIGKKRARCQAALYSIGEYISKNIESIDNKEDLDKLVLNIDKNIFSFYNHSFSQLQKHLDGTMGDNKFINKIHYLENLLDFKKINNKNINFEPLNSPNFPKLSPVITNLFLDSKSVIATTIKSDADRNVQNRVFGILFPIEREGAERMSLFHKEIFVDDINISDFFLDDFSNIIALYNGKKIYCKAILMHPFWKLIAFSKDNIYYKNILSKIIGLDSLDLENANFNDKTIVDKINKMPPNFINISNNSRVLAAKTRSEDENLLEILSIIKSKIKEIKEEYLLLNLKE